MLIIIFLFLQAVAPCYMPLQLEVSVLDSLQRKFDNVSSLVLSWAVSNEALGSFPTQPSIYLATQEIHGFSVPLSSKLRVIQICFNNDLALDVLNTFSASYLKNNIKAFQVFLF